MIHYRPSISAIRPVLALLAITILLSSCARMQFEGEGKDLPPILTQDEIIRPYEKIGRIQITVDLYATEVPNLQEWGYRTLREEAAKMKADAVVLPEVTSRPTTYLIVPSNEYRATGVAIRFK
jgi:hypothetical protein